MLSLTVTNSNESICLTSDQINFADPDLEKITITSKINCCSTEFTGELTQFSSSSCWYKQQYDLQTGGFNYNYITELTVSLNGIPYNFVVSPTEYQVLSGGLLTAYMTALELAVNVWLNNNNIDATFTITSTDGIATGSLITLQFDGFVPGFVPQTVTFKNAGTDETQQSFGNCIDDSTVTDSNLIQNGNICILPGFYGQGDTLSDGIYGVVVRADYQDGSYIEERGCSFVDAVIRCKIPGLIENGDYDAPILFDAIHTANGCIDVDCDCAMACSLFSQLIDKLNLKLITDGSITDCGCS